MRTRIAVAAAGLVVVASTAVVLAARRPEPAVSLSEATPLSKSTTVGRAPNFAVVPRGGGEVAVWVSAPGGGTDGRLYVSTGGAPVEIKDTLGPIEAHDEAPPKVVYAPDGSALYALYVVAKVVPGRRFPASALRFVRSTDGGRTWSAPRTLTDDSEFGSHNFHALHAAADGALYVAWLDGRHGKSTVYMTRSLDGGVSWEANRRVSAGEACPCCRTAIATKPDGSVYLAWRTVMPGDVRDIVVARSTDRGVTWGEPARVHADNWTFPGCPHAGPAMQAHPDGRLSIVWWTGVEGAAGVYYAQSADDARSWSAPVPIGTAAASRPAPVQLALGPRGEIVVAWADGTTRIPEVKLRVSRDGGRSFGPPTLVSAPGRSATFPVIGIAGKELAVAWSEQSAEVARREEEAKPDMKDQKAVKGLHAVGETHVMVRRGTIE